MHLELFLLTPLLPVTHRHAHTHRRRADKTERGMSRKGLEIKMKVCELHMLPCSLPGWRVTFSAKANVVRQERELLEGTERRKGAWHVGRVKIKCQQNIYVHGL